MIEDDSSHVSQRVCSCYYKLGEWQSSSVVEAGYATRTLSEETITQILDVYQCATIADRLWAKVSNE